MEAIFQDAVSKGLRNFVFAGAADLDVDSNEERFLFLKKICAKNKVPFSDFKIFWRDSSPDSAAKACADFFKGKKAEKTALVTVNDPSALRILPGAPKGVKIYSVDGSEAALKAGIISYYQPVEAMAEKSVELIQAQNTLGPAWEPQNVRIKGWLKFPDSE